MQQVCGMVLQAIINKTIDLLENQSLADDGSLNTPQPSTAISKQLGLGQLISRCGMDQKGT